MSTNYTNSQYIAISYYDEGKSHINRVFKIVKVEEVAVSGVDMLVDGVHKALNNPLPKDVSRRTEIWGLAKDGSRHRFIIGLYPHMIYTAGAWKTIK